MALYIKKYIFEHIQILNKVLANLKQASITMTWVKSQLSLTSLKIIGYFCDETSHYSNTLKVLKILNKPKYTNINFIYIFKRFCIYYQISIKNFAYIIFLIYHLLKKDILFI